MNLFLPLVGAMGRIHFGTGKQLKRRRERAERLMVEWKRTIMSVSGGWTQFWRRGRLRLSYQSELDRMGVV